LYASGQPAAFSLSTAVESSVDLVDQAAFLAVVDQVAFLVAVNLMFVRVAELEEPLPEAWHLRKIPTISVLMIV